MAADYVDHGPLWAEGDHYDTAGPRQLSQKGDKAVVKRRNLSLSELRKLTALAGNAPAEPGNPKPPNPLSI